MTKYFRMYNTKRLKVKKIIIEDEQKYEMELEDGSRAIAYRQFTPKIKVEDELIVNTTAVDLGLGTGGYHIVIYNLSNNEQKTTNNGHIMKLRYTPQQFSVRSIEAQESKYHQLLQDKSSIERLPVIIGSLHSQLAATVATIKYLNQQLRVIYIMTDGAALPIGLSNTVLDLKEKKLIDSSITCGQAFGGDIETVNIYSALISAKFVCRADIVFVSMGPGVSGTASGLGTSALEAGQVINAVASLEGLAVAIARLSFSDKRKRHQGISHHSITSLAKVALSKAHISMPLLEKKKRNYIEKQLQLSGILKKHVVEYINNDVTERALLEYSLKPSTMGRGFNEEPEFFLSCGCAAIKAIKLHKKSSSNSYCKRQEIT